MNLASCNAGTGRFSPFNKMGLFNNYKLVLEPEALTQDDCLVVWGGADISPSLYGKRKSKYGHGAFPGLSDRDNYEWTMMQRAKELGIPIIGICRGAQMLCALAGGHLIQHVDGHTGGDHHVLTVDGQTFPVSSVHHQMLYPWNVEHEMIAWSEAPRSTRYFDEDKDIGQVPCEPEFVYFPQVRGVAVQWHPEFMDDDVQATQYIRNFLQEKVL